MMPFTEKHLNQAPHVQVGPCQTQIISAEDAVRRQELQSLGVRRCSHDVSQVWPPRPQRDGWASSSVWPVVASAEGRLLFRAWVSLGCPWPWATGPGLAVSRPRGHSSQSTARPCGTAELCVPRAEDLSRTQRRV